MRSRLQQAHATWTTLLFGLVTFESDERRDADTGVDFLPGRADSLDPFVSAGVRLPSMFMPRESE